VSEGTVDIVVAVTMDYQTSRGDFGVVRMRYQQSGGEPVDLEPGAFRLDSQGGTTSTTLMWKANDVDAGGAQYEFALLALPRNRSSDAHFHFKGSRFSVVIEMWSSG
jgi:hypothetical protein